MVKQRSQIPIEQRNYSVHYMVFAGLLFVATMWAVVDEVSSRRPWKDVQRQYRKVAAAKVQERLDQSIADLDSTSLSEAAARLQAAQDSVRGPVYRTALGAYNGVLEDLIKENRKYQFAKSRGDEAYYFYKKSVHEGGEDENQKKRLAGDEAEMAGHMAAIKVIEARRDSINAILAGYRAEVKKAQNTVADLRKKMEKWETKLAKIQTAPLEIKQVMMLDYDRNPFNDPKARVDRCQTCHQGWNEEVMEDAPQPFTRHPLPELLATHKPETMGCTPCHRGQGAALTAGQAHGEADHHWENPLLKGKEIWAACNECHEGQSHLDGAPVFSAAKRTMIESGCFGCHEIKGYTDLARIGPELAHINAKASPGWVYRWVKDPRDYNPRTRMPNFKFSDDQAEAVTAYLVDASAKSGFAVPRGASAGGNAGRGKMLFMSVGCLACHTLGENTKVRETRGTSYDIAPELTRVGSKVSADWIYDWIRNPRRYNPTTRMPSLRLADQEAKDIAAFLSLQKDEKAPPERPLRLASPAVIKQGEGLIREYGCAGCHLIPGMEKEGRVSVSLSNFGRKRVDVMDFPLLARLGREQAEEFPGLCDRSHRAEDAGIRVLGRGDCKTAGLPPLADEGRTRSPVRGSV